MTKPAYFWMGFECSVTKQFVQHVLQSFKPMELLMFCNLTKKWDEIAKWSAMVLLIWSDKQQLNNPFAFHLSECHNLVAKFFRRLCTLRHMVLRQKIVSSAVMSRNILLPTAEARCPSLIFDKLLMTRVVRRQQTISLAWQQEWWHNLHLHEKKVCWHH